MSNSVCKHRADVISDIDELRGLYADWRELCDATPNATFFQSPEWFNEYWKHFGSTRQLRFVRVGDPKKPVGLMPLIISQRVHKVGRLRVLEYPLDNWGNWFGPLGPSRGQIFTDAIMHLANGPRDWDLLELNGTPDGSASQETLLAFNAAGLTPVITRGEEVSLINLEGSWSNYWSERTSKWRNNVRRNEKRLYSKGQVRCLHYRPSANSENGGDPRWDLYDLCEQVSERSWQGTSTTGTTLTHPPARAFLRDVHAAASKCGTVSVNLLLVDELPVAFAYNYLYHGSVFGLRAGFDPHFASSGPGSVLLSRVIEDCFQHGDHTFDLGESPAEYKNFWRNQVQYRYRIRHFARDSFLAQALRLSQSLSTCLGYQGH